MRSSAPQAHSGRRAYSAPAILGVTLRSDCLLCAPGQASTSCGLETVFLDDAPQLRLSAAHVVDQNEAVHWRPGYISSAWHRLADGVRVKRAGDTATTRTRPDPLGRDVSVTHLKRTLATTQVREERELEPLASFDQDTTNLALILALRSQRPFVKPPQVTTADSEATGAHNVAVQPRPLMMARTAGGGKRMRAVSQVRPTQYPGRRLKFITARIRSSSPRVE